MARGGARRNRVWRSLNPTPPRGVLAVDASGFSDLSATEGVAPFQPSALFTVRTANAGLLDNVTASVHYLQGSGWLSLTVTKLPDRTYAGVPTVNVSGLSVGTYRAVVSLTDPNAENPGQEIPVTLTVATADTTLVVTPATRTLSTTEGTLGSAATVTLSNGAAGTMATPTVGTIAYGGGGSGWVASVSIVAGAGGTWTATIQSTGVGLVPGTYTCTVPFSASNALNSPQSVTCTLTVTAAAPPPSLMQLSQSTVSLLATRGSGLSPAASITVSGQQGATLGTTGTAVITGTGASALTASVLGRVVTVTAAPDALVAGSYSATVPITDTVATNSPQGLSVALTVQAASTPSSTDIDGILQLVGGTAGVSSRYQSVFPLRPGDMTLADVAARKGALYIGGVEVPIALRATQGAHNDGSLRGVEIQYDYTFANTTPVVCQFRQQVTRGTTDLTHTAATQDTLWNLGVTPYAIRAILVPTDPAYLCATLVAGSPLVPASQIDAVSYPLTVAYMDDRFESLKNIETTSTTAKSDYEHVRGLVAAWCVTGNTKYLLQALSRLRYLFVYSNDTTPSTYSPTYNLEAIGGGSGVNGNETKSQRQWGFYCGYYLTGWVPFWAIVNAGSQQAQKMANATGRSYARPIDIIYESSLSPRKQLVLTPYLWIAGLMDATRTISSPSGPGTNGSQHVTQLAKIWTDIAANKFVETHGGTGWRTGFPWCHQNYRDDDAGAVQGDWPWFQSALVCRHLVDYYLMIHAHPDIPPLLKFQVDAMVSQCGTSNGGGASSATGSDVTSATLGGVSYTFDSPMYAVPYLTKADPNVTGFSANTQPMFAPAVAFVAKYYGGNDPATGTPYATHYRRTVNPRLVFHQGGFNSALVWSWKIWGEIFSGSLLGAYLMSLSGAPTGPSSPRTPSVATAWPSA